MALMQSNNDYRAVSFNVVRILLMVVYVIHNPSAAACIFSFFAADFLDAYIFFILSYYAEMWVLGQPHHSSKGNAYCKSPQGSTS